MSLPQTLSGLQSGLYTGTTTLKIPSNLLSFPLEILSLAPTLTILDLSNNPHLSSLPAAIAQLTNLKIAFFSNCSFTTFPKELAACPSLEMVAFKGNGMKTVPENCFPRGLRWLILTDNVIETLPSSIGECGRLQKCMLAGNKLRILPGEMRECKKLGLLRLSCNEFEVLPVWLFEMPELGFLSFGGNPCATPRGSGTSTPFSEKKKGLELIAWEDLEVEGLLGEGASGVISKATWTSSTRKEKREDVAVKIFKGAVTSDGSPMDEMNVCIAAGTHPHLITPLGSITSHPSQKSGLVLELIPPSYSILGNPPNFETCTRDVFHPTTQISMDLAVRVLLGIASAAEHLHQKGIKHGDLYAHNILWDRGTGHVFLGDFGAGSFYGVDGVEGNVEGLEVFAFGLLVEDLIVLMEGEKEGKGEGKEEVMKSLNELRGSCLGSVVGERPGFGALRGVLEGLVEVVG